MTRRLISEDDLQAFVDGVLVGERLQEVTHFLAINPETAKRMTSYQKDAALLRSALAPVVSEPVPSRLNLANMIEDQRPVRKRRLAPMAAAAIMLLAIGASGGWMLKGYSLPPIEGVAALAQEASAS